MRTKISAILFILQLVMGYSAHSAMATSIIPLSLHELTERSELIVRGVVEDYESRRSENNNAIFTKYRIQITETYKGEASDRLYFVLPGGTIDGISSFAAGSPSFNKGKDVVLCLERLNESPAAFSNGAEAPIYKLVSLFQGVFVVTTEPVTGTERAISNAAKFIPPGPTFYANDEIRRKFQSVGGSGGITVQDLKRSVAKPQ